MVWAGNKVEQRKVDKVIQKLDSTLFQFNMRAWADMQKHMVEHQESFDFFSMNTGSGHRGFMMVCKNCDKLVKISWQKQDWSSDVLENCRQDIREFLGFGSQDRETKRQRIV